jgi:LmbE family N-acetylglucosaminyl deacetylase
MQPLLRKVWQRFLDPVFYRKQLRVLRRKLVAGPEEVPHAEEWKDLGDIRSAKVVVAHPDDETFCSGAIAHLVEQGVAVEVLCLTRGEGGPTGGESRASLGSRREAEMRDACDVLGAQIRFLDLIDPTAKGYRVYAPDISPADLSAKVSDMIQEADLVISHGSCGEYWHPAHLLVFDAIERIHRGRGLKGKWLTFLARGSAHAIPRLVNWDDPVYLRFDASAYHGIREKALNCHQSQLGLFRRFAEGEIHDFIEKTSIESYCLQH